MLLFRHTTLIYLLWFLCVWSATAYAIILEEKDVEFIGEGASAGKTLYMTFDPSEGIALLGSPGDGEVHSSEYSEDTVSGMIAAGLKLGHEYHSLGQLYLTWPTLFSYAIQLCSDSNNHLHYHAPAFTPIDPDDPFLKWVGGKAHEYKSSVQIIDFTQYLNKDRGLRPDGAFSVQFRRVGDSKSGIAVQVCFSEDKYSVQAIYIVENKSVVDGYIRPLWKKIFEKLKDPTAHPELTEYPPKLKENSPPEPMDQSKKEESKPRPNQHRFYHGSGGNAFTLNPIEIESSEPTSLLPLIGVMKGRKVM